MKPISVAQITQWTGGKQLEGHIPQSITGISTDSRTLKPGDLFIPLRGERFDGHDFVADAVRREAAALLIEERRVSECVEKRQEMDRGRQPLILAVPDTLLALQAIAAGYRKQFDHPVVAITGSTGKTTTKDMTASIVGQLGPVLKSQENFNNEIGLPLTLLQIESWHRTVVVEMGMRGPGQIRTLTELARPSVGVITNVGTVHLELLGSQEAIQKAKQELVETMEPGGIVALNADDPLVREMASMASDKQIIYYGYEGVQCDHAGSSNTGYVTATNITARGAQGVSFQLCYDGHRAWIDLPVPGEYQVSNALGAAAAAMAVGASLADVKAGLSQVSLSGMRMELIPWLDEGLVINDAYNANPTSMAGALKTAYEIATGRPLVLVLGDMLELGHLSTKAHRDIGRQAADLGPAYLLTVGVAAKGIAEGARDAGMPLERVVQCTDHSEAGQVVIQIARPGDVVLVKGSRGMALEHVVQALCAKL